MKSPAAACAPNKNLQSLGFNRHFTVVSPRATALCCNTQLSAKRAAERVCRAVPSVGCRGSFLTCQKSLELLQDTFQKCQTVIMFLWRNQTTLRHVVL